VRLIANDEQGRFERPSEPCLAASVPPSDR